jgi:hypothetical protein
MGGRLFLTAESIFRSIRCDFDDELPSREIGGGAFTAPPG